MRICTRSVIVFVSMHISNCSKKDRASEMFMFLFGKHMHCTNILWQIKSKIDEKKNIIHQPITYLCIHTVKSSTTEWSRQHERQRSSITCDISEFISCVCVCIFFLFSIPNHQYIDARRFLIGYLLECVSLSQIQIYTLFDPTHWLNLFYFILLPLWRCMRTLASYSRLFICSL